MKKIKDCLNGFFKEDFIVKENANDLEIVPANGLFTWLDIDYVASACKSFGKKFYVSAEIKKGVYIKIY
jgi:hypothetical protein